MASPTARRAWGSPLRRSAVLLAAVLSILFSVSIPVVRADPPYHPTGSVETMFARPGPWAVTERQGFGCCDSTGAAYDVWYPTDLRGPRHPILTWGDGTSAVPRQYTALLSHLASWGFVVIATENQGTGSGVDIAGAARYLIAQAARPDSIFHDHLDTGAVGAIGHSQGASGVLNAMIGSNGLIKTAVPLELPAQVFCSGNTATCPDSRKLRSGSVFYVNGGDDALISPSRQPPWPPGGLQSMEAYYAATPASVTKVWGTLIHANHNDVQGQPDCAGASAPCTTGVYGYLGYPTAWLVAQLWNCDAARRAFEPGTGEFYASNPNWANQIGALAR
jgi:hypothetical protein